MENSSATQLVILAGGKDVGFQSDCVIETQLIFIPLAGGALSWR